MKSVYSNSPWHVIFKQGVALTGPPCSVGRPTAHTPGRRRADRPRARRPARPPAGSVTGDDRRQPAKQYWPIRRVSNNTMIINISYELMSFVLYMVLRFAVKQCCVIEDWQSQYKTLECRSMKVFK